MMPRCEGFQDSRRMFDEHDGVSVAGNIDAAIDHSSSLVVNHSAGDRCCTVAELFRLPLSVSPDEAWALDFCERMDYSDPVRSESCSTRRSVDSAEGCAVKCSLSTTVPLGFLVRCVLSCS